jgi:hypothetical protein
MNIRAQFSKVLRFLGVDRAIAYTVIGRGWAVLAGPITLLFIANFLSAEEQGYYYTFFSVLGLQVFFELGLAIVILQFASHEKAKLEWTSRGTLEGDPVAKARLFSLLRRALVWYAIVAVLIVVTMIPGGLLFFGHYRPAQVAVMWRLPWIWVVVVSASGLLISPVIAVLEGCGLVAEVALARAGQGVVGSLLTWLVLSMHGRLFTAPVLNTVGLLWWLGWLVLRKRPFLTDLVTSRHSGVGINWWREVWPFQWKIALSGISGYFIFLLFNPVLFVFHGAVVAGQMGMSLSVMSALATIAAAWVSTKMSPFGTLIAQKQFKQLDRLFFPALWHSLSVIVLGGLAFWFADYYLHLIHHPLARRILDPLPLGLFVATTVINHIVGVEAMYLRAHKQEPFLMLSIVIACLTGLSTYFLGRQFSATGMMAGNFTITLLVGLGWGTWIFMQKRRLWHYDPAVLAAGADNPAS